MDERTKIAMEAYKMMYETPETIQEEVEEIDEEAGDGYIGPARLGIKNPMASDATRAATDKRRQQQAAAANRTGGSATLVGNTSYANRFDTARQELKGEDVDIFDTILDYLVSEGYADTNENALVIMANMSEEWKQSIMEGLGGMMMSAASRGMGSLRASTPPQGGAPRPRNPNEGGPGSQNPRPRLTTGQQQNAPGPSVTQQILTRRPQPIIKY